MECVDIMLTDGGYMLVPFQLFRFASTVFVEMLCWRKAQEDGSGPHWDNPQLALGPGGEVVSSSIIPWIHRQWRWPLGSICGIVSPTAWCCCLIFQRELLPSPFWEAVRAIPHHIALFCFLIRKWDGASLLLVFKRLIFQDLHFMAPSTSPQWIGSDQIGSDQTPSVHRSPRWSFCVMCKRCTLNGRRALRVEAAAAAMSLFACARSTLPCFTYYLASFYIFISFQWFGRSNSSPPSRSRYGGHTPSDANTYSLSGCCFPLPPPSPFEPNIPTQPYLTDSWLFLWCFLVYYEHHSLLRYYHT